MFTEHVSNPDITHWPAIYESWCPVQTIFLYLMVVTETKMASLPFTARGALKTITIFQKAKWRRRELWRSTGWLAGRCPPSRSLSLRFTGNDFGSLIKMFFIAIIASADVYRMKIMLFYIFSQDEDLCHRPDCGQVPFLVLPQAAQEVQEDHRRDCLCRGDPWEEAP